MLCDVVVVLRRWARRPRSMPLAIFTMRKELHGFLFLCMHVILFLWLWGSAWRSFGPPELCYYDERDVYTVNIKLMCYYKCFFLLHHHSTGKVEMKQLMTLTELLQYHVSGK